MASRYAGTVRAPEFPPGSDWIGPRQSLRDLRGKIVLLDFWTYCCINCMHVIPNLHELERRHPDELVVIGSRDKHLHAIDRKTGTLRWQFATRSGIDGSPVITGDRVFFGSGDKNLYCLNRETGELVWSFATRGRIDSSPVVVGDRIFFGSSDRNLYALNWDGQEVWKFPAKQAITASPAVAEGYLVIGTDSTDGRILCFGKK